MCQAAGAGRKRGGVHVRGASGGRILYQFYQTCVIVAAVRDAENDYVAGRKGEESAGFESLRGGFSEVSAMFSDAIGEQLPEFKEAALVLKPV